MSILRFKFGFVFWVMMAFGFSALAETPDAPAVQAEHHGVTTTTHHKTSQRKPAAKPPEKFCCKTEGSTTCELTDKFHCGTTCNANQCDKAATSSDDDTPGNDTAGNDATED